MQETFLQENVPLGSNDMPLRSYSKEMPLTLSFENHRYPKCKQIIESKPGFNHKASFAKQLINHQLVIVKIPLQLIMIIHYYGRCKIYELKKVL